MNHKDNMPPKQPCQILNGQPLAEKTLREVRHEIVEKKLNLALAVILVGDDPASKIYVSLKQKACLKCGLEFYLYQIPKDADKNQIIECLEFLNEDPDINAIIIQLPLPEHLNEDEIILRLNPKKDADGFHPQNLKLIAEKKPSIMPALHQGIIKLLEATKENLKEKNVVVISNSPVFALPLPSLLEPKSCAWVSPNDKGLTQKTLEADIIIIAIGSPNFLKASMIKKDAIIIDVGYNRVRNKPVGDVDFKSCAKKALFISPVPGGIGPLTVAMLMANVVELAKYHNS